MTRALLLAESSSSLQPLAGIPVVQRLIRTLRRNGVQHVRIVVPGGDAAWPAYVRIAEQEAAAVVCASGATPAERLQDAWPEGADCCLVADADLTCDPRLVTAVAGAETPSVLVDSEPQQGLADLVGVSDPGDEPRLVGLALVGRDWVERQSGDLTAALRQDVAAGLLATVDVARVPVYHDSLRRPLRPYWFPTPPARLLGRARRVLADATQKGAQDLPAIVHGPIENALALSAAGAGITPDQITIFTNVLAWLVVALFATGHLGVGILIAAFVGILDGVDGKLARLIVKTTPLGAREHALDIVYQVAWAGALFHYLAVSGLQPLAWQIGGLTTALSLTEKLLQDLTRARSGRFIDEHGPFDRFVRLWGARRNTFVWVFGVGVLVGRPGEAFVALPVLAALTVLVHLPRAWSLLRRHAPATRPAPGEVLPAPTASPSRQHTA